MNSLLSYFIEANLYLISFYLLYQLLLAKDKHFRFNRAFLLAGILLSIFLPLLSFTIQATSQTENLFEGYIMLPAITISNVQTESVGFILKWWHIIGIIYLAGVLFYLFKLIWQIAQIFGHLPFLNSTRERKNGYTLVTTNGDIPTCSFFKFLLWDKSASLSEDEQKLILEHELVHIRQWHSIDVLLVEVLRAIFWFNPVIHLLKSRLTEVHEYLADQYAAKQIDVEKYSKLLTLQVFKSFDFALSNNFHKSQIVKRLRMLKSGRSKSIWINIGLLVPALALLITVLSCDVTEDILPNLTLNEQVPNIPNGWEFVSEENVSVETKKHLEKLRNEIPDVKLYVAKSVGSNVDPKFLFEAMENSKWLMSMININKQENKYSVVIRSGKSDPVLKEEIVFEDINTTDVENDPKEIFTIVENQPTPIGGMTAFYQYVGNSLKYPDEAKGRGIEGKVFVQFLVDPDGKLTDVKAVKGIGGGCDEEAVRVIRESLAWKPGTQRGRNVNVRMILPITFKLN